MYLDIENLAANCNRFNGGKPAPDGVYVWKTTFQELNSDVRRSLTGHVNLLR